MVQAAPSTWSIIEEINNCILSGDLYRALKESRKLIELEERLLNQAQAASTAET